MPSTLVDSRVKSGTLRLEDPSDASGWRDVSCAPSSVAVTPSSSTTAAGDSLEVLCGLKFAGDSGQDNNEATLDLTIVSDFLKAGIVQWSWKHAGENMHFEWIPNSSPDSPATATSVTWKGTVLVQPIQVGGEVNTRLTPSVSWQISSLQLPPDYGGTWWIVAPPIQSIKVPATGQKRWTYDPNSATAPASLGDIKAHTAIGDTGASLPARDFTVGEYALLSDRTHVHYKAAGGWAAGDAT